MKMDGVSEYAEGYDVELLLNDEGILVIRALNEGGYNCTEVDLIQLINWLKQEHPDLL